ncbi:MAG: hypothetical protein WBF13_11175 [Candidatus Zixiibacteriota bacterium]
MHFFTKKLPQVALIVTCLSIIQMRQLGRHEEIKAWRPISQPQTGTGGCDLLVKETKILSENYQVTASVIKESEETFTGFVIHVRESSGGKRS